MKKLIYLMIVTLTVTGAMAQAPNKMSYQTVIRNAGGSLLANQAVGMRISVLQGTSTGTAVFVETHAVTTNANGLASLEIGGGTAVTGTIGGIDWSAGPYFIKTETDPAGGTNYSITGTSELLSVPYALHASSSGDNNWTKTGNNISNANSGNVGIGTNTPGMPLDVISVADTNGSAAIRGVATGTTHDIYGVMGSTTSSGYEAAGVFGKATSQNAAGVLGKTSGGPNSAAVWGDALNSAWGVIGTNNNVNGMGVAGYGGGGVSVLGESGLGGIGVKGMSNASGVDTNTAAYFKASGGTANYAIIVPSDGGNVGIGTVSPVARLDVAGSIKITDGSQGAGKVLTSDANGLATWASPAAGVGFRAYHQAGTLTSGQNFLIYSTEQYDDGNGYNPATGVYTAPATGVYLLNASAEFYSYSGYGTGYITFGFEIAGGSSYDIVSGVPNSVNTWSLARTAIVKLNAGETVKVRVFHYLNGGTGTLSSTASDAYSVFSAAKLY